MKAFKVWNNGGYIQIAIGDKVTVFRSGGGRSTFGEPGALTRATKQHLVFTTESGAEVKTPIDNISHTVGKAKASRYCVTLRPFEDFGYMIKENVRYWNNKTLEFDKK